MERFLWRGPGLHALARVPPGQPALARRVLRQLRARVLIWSAAAEARGESPLVTGRLWADFADAAIELADRVAYHQVVGRLGLPRTEAGAEVGRAILGLGKLGSRELNPSSDVDLMFVYETDAGSCPDKTLHEFYVRWVRSVREILADVDEDGFCFRVDLDLRPEGTQGALANSVDALEDYYERFGLLWERAALLRLRPVVDRGQTGQAVLRRLRPFLHPRSLEPTVLDELGDMRARIEATAPDSGFDVKRSWGGIRDVEFRVQGLQLLYSGKVPELRSGSVLELLGHLETAGLLEHRAAVDLAEGYTFLRRVEHALQYVEDRQTQLLPDRGDVRTRVTRALTRACRLPGSGFDAHLERVRARVREIYDEMFGERRGRPTSWSLLVLDRTASVEQRTAALGRLGYPDPELALRFVEQLARRPASPFWPASMARAPVRQLAARLLDQGAGSPRPMVALSRLPDFFEGRGRSHDVLELLAGDERASRLLMRALATSSSLSRLLTRHAAFVGDLIGGPRPRRRSRQVLLETLRELPEGGDEEDALVQMRRVCARETLRQALGFLDGRLGLIEAGHRLTLLAEAALERALEVARGRVARRFGEPVEGQIAVLGLGRLGSREMGFASDLDLLFVYDGEGETTGPRRIEVAEWAVRVAQQTMWALSTPLAEGSCYEVDTRLRPSGSQGPLCVSLPRFVRYHDEDAALWERQALLRLRPVAGDRALGVRCDDAARRAALAAPPMGLGMSLLDMRQRMIDERTRGEEGFDLKLSDGGIADVEFAVQGLQLAWGHDDQGLWCPSTRRALRRLRARGRIDEREETVLRGGLDLLVAVREAIMLLDDSRSASVTRSDDRLELLARLGGIGLDADSGPALYAKVIDAAARVREVSGGVLLRL